MRSLEIHVFETDADLDSGVLGGLLTVEDLDAVACTACLDEVGHTNGSFVSYTTVLDDVDQWYLCIPCTGAVLEPSAAAIDEPIYLLDVDDEEFETFDLTDD
jgi:hypothetical protein